VHVVERLQKLLSAERALMARLDREATPAELAAELQWPVDAIEDLRAKRQLPVSLQTPVGNEDENATLEQFVHAESEGDPDEVAIRNLTKEDVQKALEELPARLKMILELRFGMTDQRPRTLEEVGQALGVTRERVRQLERQAIQQLKRSQRLWMLYRETA